MASRQIQLSENTLKKIAEALFLAYTAEQAAYLGGISKTTLARIKASPKWKEIEEKSLLLEKAYRLKVWRGEPGWQGAAWMLERKYPGQLSRPEIQLQVNTDASTTNNVLVITAEQASHLKSRSSAMEAELSHLTPKGKQSTPALTDASTPSSEVISAPASQSSNPPASSSNPLHSPTRTPGRLGSETTPHLPRKSQLSGDSSNSDKSPQVSPNSKSADLSSNSEPSKKSGRYKTVAEGRKKRNDAGQRAAKRAMAKQVPKNKGQ